MDAIRAYLDMMFEDSSLKHEEAVNRHVLEQRMVSSYHMYMKQGLTQNASMQRTLSDYEPIIKLQSQHPDCVYELDQQIHQSAHHYADAHRKGSFRIALGLFISLFSIVPLLLMSAYLAPQIGHELVVALGIIAMLWLLGYGLWILIRSNRSLDHGHPVEHIVVHMTPSVRNQLRHDRLERVRPWGLLLLLTVSSALGGALILQLIWYRNLTNPLLYTAAWLLLSLAVALATHVGMQITAYRRLLQREDRLTGSRMPFGLQALQDQLYKLRRNE